MKTITTHATAATVYRWATQGSKRLRAKYRHAETVCRVLNRREAPIMGLDPAGTYGHIGCIKLSWGYGHIRECGPVDDCALGMRTEASVPPWGSGESLAVYRFEMRFSEWTTIGAYGSIPIVWAGKTPAEIIAHVHSLINSLAPEAVADV